MDRCEALFPKRPLISRPMQSEMATSYRHSLHGKLSMEEQKFLRMEVVKCRYGDKSFARKC